MKQRKNDPMFQINTPTNNSLSPQNPTTPYDRYGKRLTIIEQHLNTICSQHDSLMPLLTLLDIMPQLSKSDSQMRNIHRKIHEMQARLSKMHQIYRDSKQTEIIEEAQEGFAQVASSLQQCKETITALQTNKHTHAVETTQLATQIELKIEQSRKEIQSMLADFKNQIEMEQKQPESHASLHEIREQLKNVHREISLARIQLPEIAYSQLHKHSFSRISYEIYQLQEMKRKNQDIQERAQWLGDQIRGLRKKYLMEVAWEQKHAREQQEQYAHDLDSLEHKRQTLLR